MSMQLFAAGHRDPAFRPSHVEASPRVRRTNYLRVKPKYKCSTIELCISSEAPLYISQQLLSEILKVCGAIRGLPESPFHYRVFCSELPRTFSLGGDLALFRDCIKMGDRESLSSYANLAVKLVWEGIAGSGYSDLCSIAVVAGEAQGGGFEAALASHVLIAERGCAFGFPESLFGLFPGMGAKRLLEARTDRVTAEFIIGSGRRWRAEELHECGVVDILTEQGCAMDVARSYVGDGKSPANKEVLHRYRGIKEADLINDVECWVDQAMMLSDQKLRAMALILEAQKRTSTQLPNLGFNA